MSLCVSIARNGRPLQRVGHGRPLPLWQVHEMGQVVKARTQRKRKAAKDAKRKLQLEAALMEGAGGGAGGWGSLTRV